MFSKYNYDNFPNVFVNFSENINSEFEFEKFLNDWMILYYNCKDFSFVFDTRCMGYISPLYCIKMAFFIKSLRKEKYHYLKKSLILVDNDSIKNLLDFVFSLQSPVSPVYIWNTKETNEKILIDVINKITIENIKENMIYIKPNCSFISFL